MEENIAKSYSEVDVILSKLDKQYYNKISNSFLNFIKNNEDKAYKIYFKNNENSIKISKLTQTLLALVYRSYFCNAEQRIKYDSILNKNQKKFDEEQIKKYNIEKIFNQRRVQMYETNDINQRGVEENVQLVVVKKENIFVRLFKLLFKKKE